PSMRWAGKLADRGWNLLIFPEGAETLTGEIEPFKAGVGVMVSWLHLPVVPVRVEGLFAVLPHETLWPRPGRASVRFGRPLSFPSTASYLEITRQIEDAVRGL
ncbi:MAG TPA: lysophospholipid acyltransferase family protein, partial [Chloroflexota bacterium]|nr:lysophospholipid acyltransferase family protein [Chloroflexota bacterium]